MEDISNYFYLIFLVISLILGAFGKKKKKGSEGKTSNSNFINDFLDELDPAGGRGSDQKVQEPVQQRSEPEDEPAMENPQTDVNDSRQPLSELAKYNDVSKKAKELRELSRKEITSDSTEMDFRKQPGRVKSVTTKKALKHHPLDDIDFDIKNAVIYDAILNRPKF